jgi:hypothetical protein
MVKVSNWVHALSDSVIGRNSDNEELKASFLFYLGAFTQSSQRSAKLFLDSERGIVAIHLTDCFWRIATFCEGRQSIADTQNDAKR